LLFEPCDELVRGLDRRSDGFLELRADFAVVPSSVVKSATCVFIVPMP